MNNAIIIGSTSGVGRALATYLSMLDFRLLLIARSKRDLVATVTDLSVRHKNEISYLSLDISNMDNIDELIKFLLVCGINYNHVYICAGEVLENDGIGIEKKSFQSMINVNFAGIAYFINRIVACNYHVDYLRIIVISSIAVSRPRGNNIIYSTAKSSLDFYCRALQHKLWDTKISVKVVRLGYVNTSMTYGRKLLFPVVEPMYIAKKIHKMILSNSRVCYLPGYWKIIHIFINILNWNLYKRLKF